ncbi:PHD and RING finger domain-containing protein 1 [Caerostris extrusa]|uniref:PHD and RING finger domain-containing protein 1 n=1 Tax=Caerostris extrusa TaxID=172846 RepID=A0AAV4Y046_CAEEX|nr:PHD and RING finger domain-containing protein 1 [Caerostris extrusa]
MYCSDLEVNANSNLLGEASQFSQFPFKKEKIAKNVDSKLVKKESYNSHFEISCITSKPSNTNAIHETNFDDEDTMESVSSQNLGESVASSSNIRNLNSNIKKESYSSDEESDIDASQSLIDSLQEPFNNRKWLSGITKMPLSFEDECCSKKELSGIKSFSQKINSISDKDETISDSENSQSVLESAADSIHSGVKMCIKQEVDRIKKEPISDDDETNSSPALNILPQSDFTHNALRKDEVQNSFSKINVKAEPLSSDDESNMSKDLFSTQLMYINDKIEVQPKCTISKQNSNSQMEDLPCTQLAKPSFNMLKGDLPCNQSTEPFNRQIDYISCTQLAESSNEQIDDMPCTQLAESSNEQIDDMPCTQLAESSNEEIDDMPCTQLAESSNEQIDDMPCTQLAESSNEQIDDMPCTQLAVSSNEQIDDMLCTQLAESSNEQIDDMPCTQLAESFNEQIDDMPCTQLIERPSESHVNQFKKASSSMLVNDSPCTQLVEPPSDNQFKKPFSNTPMNDLPCNQLADSSNVQIDDLPRTQLIEHSSERQVNQLNKLSHLLMDDLPCTQLAEHPSDNQFKKPFSNMSMDDLPCTQLAESFNRELDDLPCTQLAEPVNNQMGDLPCTQLAEPVNNQMGDLSCTLLEESSNGQIDDMPCTQLIEHPSERQINQHKLSHLLMDDLPCTQLAEHPSDNQFKKPFSDMPMDDLPCTQLAESVNRELDDLPCTQLAEPVDNQMDDLPCTQLAESFNKKIDDLPCSQLAGHPPNNQFKKPFSKICHSKSFDLQSTSLSASVEKACFNVDTNQIDNKCEKNDSLVNEREELPGTQLAIPSENYVNRYKNQSNQNLDEDVKLSETQSLNEHCLESLKFLEEKSNRNQFKEDEREQFTSLLSDIHNTKKSPAKKVGVHRNLPQMLVPIPGKGLPIPKPSSRKTFSFDQVKQHHSWNDNDDSLNRNMKMKKKLLLYKMEDKADSKSIDSASKCNLSIKKENKKYENDVEIIDAQSTADVLKKKLALEEVVLSSDEDEFPATQPFKIASDHNWKNANQKMCKREHLTEQNIISGEVADIVTINGNDILSHIKKEIDPDQQNNINLPVCIKKEKDFDKGNGIASKENGIEFLPNIKFEETASKIIKHENKMTNNNRFPNVEDIVNCSDKLYGKQNSGNENRKRSMKIRVDFEKVGCSSNRDQSEKKDFLSNMIENVSCKSNRKRPHTDDNTHREKEKRFHTGKDNNRSDEKRFQAENSIHRNNDKRFHIEKDIHKGDKKKVQMENNVHRDNAKRFHTEKDIHRGNEKRCKTQTISESEIIKPKLHFDKGSKSIRDKNDLGKERSKNPAVDKHSKRENRRNERDISEEYMKVEDHRKYVSNKSSGKSELRGNRSENNNLKHQYRPENRNRNIDNDKDKKASSKKISCQEVSVKRDFKDSTDKWDVKIKKVPPDIDISHCPNENSNTSSFEKKISVVTNHKQKQKISKDKKIKLNSNHHEPLDANGKKLEDFQNYSSDVEKRMNIQFRDSISSLFDSERKKPHPFEAIENRKQSLLENMSCSEDTSDGHSDYSRSSELSSIRRNKKRSHHQKNAFNVLYQVADEIIGTSDKPKFDVLKFADETMELDNSKKNSSERKVDRKYIKDEIAAEVKMALKPFYTMGLIDKDDYKEIMRKVVPKVYLNCGNIVNPGKIKNLVDAYVKRLSQS